MPERIVYHPHDVAALSTPLRRTIGARQIAIAAIVVVLAGLLAWYLIAIWHDLAPWLRGWKRYPDGWSWKFLETVPRWDRFTTAVLGAGVIVGSLAWLNRSADSAARRRVFLGLAMLVLGTYVLQVGTLGLKLSSPNALLVQRILDEDFTGYYQAAETVQSPADFFNDWRRLINACGHCGGHPTGATAFYWPFIRIAHMLPSETAEALSGWIYETFRLRVRNVDPPTIIAAFSIGHLNLLLAAVSIVPYFTLGRLLSGTMSGGILTAGLVATMPGLILMSPELDQIYLLIAGAALLFLILGLRAPKLGSQVWLGASCGLLVALGLFMTWGLLIWIPFLACISVAFVLGFQAAAGSHEIPPAVRIRRAAIASIAAIVAAIVPYLIIGALTPYDVRDVAKHGLDSHQGFEALSRPGGAIWLFHGPLDTVQFIGLPLTLAALATVTASAGRPALRLGQTASSFLGSLNIYSVALVGIVVVTFVGDYMKAESGRQLLFLMPLAALAVASAVRAGSDRIRPWHVGLLVAQILVTITIGARWLTP
jgi:hypothetical protein